MERRPEFLVVRVDRTDPSKNIVRGFRAFALFLDMHPEMHGRVTMLALLDPSRQDVPEYSEYLAAVQREARTVNDRFQHEGWLPIDLQVADNFAQSVAAYKQYDALLVNAVFDGLNLVSKEAPLLNERDGVLILSENTGSSEELARVGADGQSVRRLRTGAGDQRGVDDAGRRAPPAHRGDARARARERSGRRGSRRSSPISTGSPHGSRPEIGVRFAAWRRQRFQSSSP